MTFVSLRNDLDVHDLIRAYKAGESASSLARRFKANLSTILDRLRKARVRIRTRAEQKERRLNLDSTQTKKLRTIVDGLLLGDGSIDPRGSLHIGQAPIRQGWLKEIAERLAALGATSKIVSMQPRDGVIRGRKIRSSGGYRLYMPAYIELKAERARWYPKGTKRVPVDMSFDSIALAYWFCGDGTYDKQGALFFCTNGFLKKEVVWLARRLTGLGITARCKLHVHGQWQVVITQRDAAVRLKDYIRDHVPECCAYKFQHVRAAIPRGSLQAKLSAQQAAEVRTRCAVGEKRRALAAEFGVSKTTIYKVIHGEVHRELSR
jgi:Mor family transcriptional regulator